MTDLLEGLKNCRYGVALAKEAEKPKRRTPKEAAHIAELVKIATEIHPRICKTCIYNPGDPNNGCPCLEMRCLPWRLDQWIQADCEMRGEETDA
ncbi:hypothetical protein LCGC14_3079790 [marine sediment metagenome]|uniref:Uncharacterized protein n=1 Tax=marine sediment metagenome TaxID=412755 RepID=A0A0F8Z4E5_9ZZZZ